MIDAGGVDMFPGMSVLHRIPAGSNEVQGTQVIGSCAGVIASCRRFIAIDLNQRRDQFSPIGELMATLPRRGGETVDTDAPGAIEGCMLVHVKM